jgi:hypothetical protein
MWMLRNRTPYAAERSWARGKSGEHHWIVAVKATFDLAPGGRLALKDEQPPPLLAPQYQGEPGRSSLRYDSDLLGVKFGTDLLVNAHAHAPGGRPAPTVPVSLQAGSMRKVLLVNGARFYAGRGNFKASSPRPFTTMPISYELAYGGMDTLDPDPRRHGVDARNPIGRGFAAHPARLRDQPAHAIDYPSGDPARTGPAGFGAIDRWWSPRLELAGSYGPAWAAKKKPLLPDDYDDGFEQSAPRDQRPAQELRGGEPIELVNMSRHGTLRFALPRITLGFTTAIGARKEPHGCRLAAVVVEPEEARLMMVWQSSLRVPAKDVEQLDHTTIVERRGAG